MFLILLSLINFACGDDALPLILELPADIGSDSRNSHQLTFDATFDDAGVVRTFSIDMARLCSVSNICYTHHWYCACCFFFFLIYCALFDIYFFVETCLQVVVCPHCSIW